MIKINDQLIGILLNYGIAGVVIYMFYTLITTRLEKLSDNIAKLTEEIIRLREELKKLNGVKG